MNQTVINPSSIDETPQPKNSLAIADFIAKRDEAPNKLFTNGIKLIKENLTMVQEYPKSTVNIKSVIQIWRDESRKLWAAVRCDDTPERTPTHFDLIDFAKDKSVVSKHSIQNCNALIADAADKYPDTENHLFTTSSLPNAKSWAMSKNIIS